MKCAMSFVNETVSLPVGGDYHIGVRLDRRVGLSAVENSASSSSSFPNFAPGVDQPRSFESPLRTRCASRGIRRFRGRRELREQEAAVGVADRRAVRPTSAASCAQTCRAASCAGTVGTGNWRTGPSRSVSTPSGSCRPLARFAFPFLLRDRLPPNHDFCAGSPPPGVFRKAVVAEDFLSLASILSRIFFVVDLLAVRCRPLLLCGSRPALSVARPAHPAVADAVRKASARRRPDPRARGGTALISFYRVA